MPAHLDGVTSLSIAPSGFTLVSSGQDCSVRFWDLLKTHACVQEATVHRKKSGEGVLDVLFHGYGSAGSTGVGGGVVLASAGADGIVKIYSTA